MTFFIDRVEAGRRLGAHLQALRSDNVVVLGIPRGGVPVAAEVAAALEAPLDVVVVRKLGIPFSPEVAMGAIGEGGVKVLDEQLVSRWGIDSADIFEVERRESVTLEERTRAFRHDREPIDLRGRTVIIVDDGIATGATASVACRIARERGAARVILAAPVGSPDAVRTVEDADDVICLGTPPGFQAVGQYYRTFGQTTESEVLDALTKAHERMARTTK